MKVDCPEVGGVSFPPFKRFKNKGRVQLKSHLLKLWTRFRNISKWKGGGVGERRGINPSRKRSSRNSSSNSSGKSSSGK